MTENRQDRLVEYPHPQLKLLPLETSIALTTAQLEGEKDSHAREEECRVIKYENEKRVVEARRREKR